MEKKIIMICAIEHLISFMSFVKNRQKTLDIGCNC